MITPISTKDQARKVREKAQSVCNSLSVVQMNFQELGSAKKERKTFSVATHYTEVPGIGIAKDIDREGEIKDTLYWQMIAQENIIIKRHKHPNIEFIFVVDGQIIVSYDDRDVLVNKFDAHVIPENVPHKVVFAERTVFNIGWTPEIYLDANVVS